MISQADRARLQTYLRRMLRNPDVALDAPARAKGAVHLRIGDDVLGTVDQVDDEGERSWAVTLIVLEDDL
ncbi:DUF3126 family protein [Acidisphaera sp. L21]|uniref:DUF3126 family protein n=1 Tax=Acidisphaera sp. L21 TaxID=1641851 RepID=UPI00131A86E7|nr:DUF3126 family protein [Acidisphaera sp. L21]